MVEDTAAPPEESVRRGDPLEGLWTWRDHPAARYGMIAAILLGLLILFPVLALWAF